MNNVSLYRKYRPNNFANVVGQDNIVTTLSNEISMNKLTHAYLFSGPRGCGKTSIAKIFSKEINQVETDNYVDIWEMDAASNNGVDEIRKVIESVNYLPVELKYKVYIIDEVHMLSKAAFNALLKTLEEPPSYAIFILATTEIHKIPPTIISRCQRFDFNRINDDAMVNRMVEILDIEKVTYEKEALYKISKLADGALRDGLSILESIISTQNSVTYEGISKVLNIVDEKDIDTILNYVDQKDITKLLDHYYQLKIKGIDEIRFLNDIIIFIKDKIIYGKNYYYTKFLPLLQETSYNIEFSKAKNLLLEILFIQLCELEFEGPKNIVADKINTTATQKEVLPVDKKESEVKNEEVSNISSVVDQLETKMVNTVTHFGFIDVLKNATSSDKTKFQQTIPEFINIAMSKNIGSIALFFEEATIIAACNNAVIIGTNDNYINDFNKKKPVIHDIIESVDISCEHVFLIGQNEWLQKRPRYIEEIKKEKTIFDIAVDNFGSNIVRKV